MGLEARRYSGQPGRAELIAGNLFVYSQLFVHNNPEDHQSFLVLSGFVRGGVNRYASPAPHFPGVSTSLPSASAIFPAVLHH